MHMLNVQNQGWVKEFHATQQHKQTHEQRNTCKHMQQSNAAGSTPVHYVLDFELIFFGVFRNRLLLPFFFFWWLSQSYDPKQSHNSQFKKLWFRVCCRRFRVVHYSQLIDGFVKFNYILIFLCAGYFCYSQLVLKSPNIRWVRLFLLRVVPLSLHVF